jgi:hypothetical protein
LDPQPASGTIPGTPKGTVPITVNYDVAGLEVGEYMANLVISHTGAKGDTIVPVVVNVGGGNNIIEIDPDPIFAAMEYTLNDTCKTFVYLGGEFDGGGHVVSEIDETTVLVNGLTPDVTPEILPSYIGFTGEVMKIRVSCADFINTYPLLWDTDTYTYSVTGDYTAGGSFVQDGEVVMVGHISGDPNFDQVVNIFDATYIISYLYMNGPAPQPIIETGDADGNGAINLLDVTRLVGFLYMEGNPPTHP